MWNQFRNLILGKFSVFLKSAPHDSTYSLSDNSVKSGVKNYSQLSHFPDTVDSISGCAIFITDLSGMIATWNEGAKKLFDYSEIEILSKPFSKIFSLEDVKLGRCDYQLSEAKLSGSIEDDCWNYRKDGTRFWANILISSVKTDAGKTYGYLCIIKDQTERKRADDHLKRNQKLLEKKLEERSLELKYYNDDLAVSQRRYEELVNSVDGIVWESDIHAITFSFISRQAERILGYSIESWLTERNFFQKILHEEDKRKGTWDFTQGKSQNRQTEYRLIAKDGTSVWFKDFATVIVEHNKPTKLCGIMVDITDRKKIEAEITSTKESALEAARVKSEFLANMSHEIRTPLNAVIGMSSLALSTKLSSEQHEYLSTIKSSADTLLSLINDILDLSKIEAGKLTLEVLDFNLDILIRTTHDLFALAAKNKGLSFSIDIAQNVPKNLRGDPGRLLQILMNLLSNSLKFTSEGEISVSVTLTHSPPAPTVIHDSDSLSLCFKIHDSGIGISDKVRSQLFHPFSQGDSSTARKYGGTGLGLSICKSLVDVMGGQIGVQSILGKGSDFWFVVPLEKAQNPLHEKPSPFPAVEILHSASPLRILVAEDNATNQKIMLKFFEKLGCQADAFADGKEVLQILDRRSYDVIFMDCQMPEMDGYEATRKIRENESITAKPRIPIIALTAHALTGDREKCILAGMDDYLSKPVDFGVLEKTLAKWTRAVISPNTLHPISSSPVKTQGLASDPDNLLTLDHSRLFELKSIQQPGDPDLVTEIVSIFFKTAPEYLRKITAFNQENKLDSLAREAHSFKSTCGSIGAQVLANLCLHLETADQSLPAQDRNQLVSKLSQEYELVDSELNQILNHKTAV